MSWTNLQATVDGRLNPPKGWRTGVPERAGPRTHMTVRSAKFPGTRGESMELTLSPKLSTYIVARDARGLIQFIERAVGGKRSFELSDPTGRLAHAEVQIADGLVMIGEAPVGRDPFPAMLHLYVEDAAAAFRRAISAGAREVQAVGDSGDGFLRGGAKDPWGNEWWFSSPVKRQ